MGAEMTTSHRFRTMALAGAAGLALVFASTVPALAAPAQHRFSIPAGPLSQAAAAFTAQSGVPVTIDVPGAAAMRVGGVSGSYADQEAFDRMLAGSGLSWHVAGGAIVVDGSVTPALAGDHVLGAVRVEGVEGEASPMDGFGTDAGVNGSSDPTATEGSHSLAAAGASVATKTPMTIKETPQTVSVITSQQIQQQNLTDIYSALEATPGVTLADSTGNGGLQNHNIISRGYDVSTFVVDGGAPINYQIRGGQTMPDLSEYDHIEVLKGSDALFGGAGDPGGVVNLQRKRPLDHDQVVFSGHYGSWRDGRVELDATGPIAFDGALKGRLDVAYQDKDYFYALAHQDTLHLYGVLEGDIGDKTEIRVGGSYQSQDSHGDDAFGLPRTYDGGDLHLPRSTNFSEPWAFTRNRNDEEFIELDHEFTDRWRFSSSATRIAQDTTALEPYFQGPVASDGGGLTYVGPDYSRLTNVQYAVDAHLNGAFDMLGHTQKILVGADYQNATFSDTVLNQSVYGSVNVFNPDLAQFAAWPGVPDPANSPDGGQSVILRAPNHQYGVYANLMLEPIRGLHINGGLRYSNYYSSAYSALYFYIFGMRLGQPTTTIQTIDNVVTPAASIVYDISKTVSAYFSYADIFQQAGVHVTAGGGLLPPERGVTYEGGLKAVSPDGKLNATFAVFSAQLQNIPLQVATGISPNGACCYLPNAAQTNSGFELQLSGQLARGWQVNAGYTYLQTSYNSVYQAALKGDIPFYSSQQPRHQLKIWSAYTPPSLARFTFLTGLRLDSARFTTGSACSTVVLTGYCTGSYITYNFTQPLYAVVDLGVEYHVDKHWTASLNVTNVTDTRYYATAGSNMYLNFYGEPRKVLFSLRAQY